MSDLVSIIVPTYNYGRYICDSIDSVLSQSHQTLQLIVVDDGSSDDTRQKLERYGARLRYIYQENKGLSAARNVGLAAADGDFVQLLDSDDLLHSRSIEYRLEALKSSESSSWVVGQNCYFSSKPVVMVPSIFRPRWGLHSMDLDARLFQSNIAPPHAFLGRRELFEDVGDFDTSLRACEDYDYWMRALSKGYTPTYSPKGLVYYRRHSNSMSKNLAQQWQHDVVMHRRIAQILVMDRFREHTVGNVLNRLFYSLGIMKTLNSANLDEADTIAELLDLYKAQLEVVSNSINLIGADLHDLRVFCVLYQILSEARRFDSGNGRPSPAIPEEIYDLFLDSMDISRLSSEFIQRYLVNGDANLKTTLDYMRWLANGIKWKYSSSRGHGDF